MSEQSKSRKSKILFWLGTVIFIGLVLIVAQYLYWKYNTDDNLSTPKNYGIIEHKSNLSSAIDNYETWADSLPDKKMNLDHHLTNTGLKKMANILTLLADFAVNNKSVQNEIAIIKSMADSVTYNWESGRHADMIKMAFFKTAAVIENLPVKASPTLKNELNTLKAKTSNINARTLTLNQRDDIKDAFKQAAVTFKTIEVISNQ